MISGINSITITGIANNPELSKTRNGDPMLRFTLAGTEVGTDDNGERINLPFYRNITVFGRQANRYYPLLKTAEGMTPVFIHGHLVSTDREINGEIRSDIRIRVQEMHILAWLGARMDNPIHEDQRQQNRLAEAANQVNLLGTLVRDMDFRQTQNEHLVINSRLAVNTKTRNYKGEVNEHTLFIDFSAWSALAVYFQDLEKGTTIYLRGRLKQRSYERDGKRHYRDYVDADAIEVIERPSKLQPSNAAAAEAAQQPPAPHQQADPAATATTPQTSTPEATPEPQQHTPTPTQPNTQPATPATPQTPPSTPHTADQQHAAPETTPRAPQPQQQEDPQHPPQAQPTPAPEQPTQDSTPAPNVITREEQPF